MRISKLKQARLAALQKARQAREAKSLAKQLNHSGYQIKVEESENDEQDSIKVEVKEEPEDDDPDNFENEEEFYWNTEEHDQQDTPPVLPSVSSSSSTISPLYPQPIERREKCLLCYKTIDTTDPLTDSAESSFRTMFLIKKMFNVPNTKLEDYLVNFGSPGTWVAVCIKCGVLVDRALGVQKKINQLEKSLRSCQQEMISVVKKSQPRAQLFTKSSQNSVIRVTNEARQFACIGAANADHQKEVRPIISQKGGRRPPPKASSCAIPEPPCAVNIVCTSGFNDASPLSNFGNLRCPVIPQRPLESPSNPVTANITEKKLKMDTSTTHICILCPHLHEMPLQSFLIHIMFHHKRPFQCSGCKLYYAHPKELQVSPLHDEKSRKEDASDDSLHVCTVDTLVETKFEPNEIWTCDQCPKMFDLESERDSHKHQVHQNQIMTDWKYKCITCDRKYKHFNDWRLHRVLEHPEVAALSCYFCDEYFGVKMKEGVDVLLNRENRRAHVKAQHGKNISKYDLNACDHCGEIFATATELGSHQQEVHRLPPKKTHSCPICWTRFKNYTSVTTHLQSFHRVGCPEAYVCEICGHSSTRSMTLAQHNLVEHGIRPASDRLTVHSCKSEGCKFESILKGRFEKHMIKVHGADRKHTCQFCGKGFLDPKHCREHEKIHTNKTAKPYKCEICGNSFAVKNYLYIHMRLSHLNRPFASTHKKRPYRKRVTPKATGSSPHCDQGISSCPVESTAIPPPGIFVEAHSQQLHNS